MNRFLLFILLLFALPSLCQEKTLYYFQVSLEHPEYMNITTKEDGSLEIKNKKNRRETTLFKENKVFTFQPAFPNSKRENLKKVYRITTENEELPYLLLDNNPEQYSNISPYFNTPDAYYPNDYGTTSPVENLGAPFPLTNLDAMNLPQAWKITKGNKKVVIGISDANIDSTDIDLQGRISKYLKYFDLKSGSLCSHGTGVASIIGGKIDNAYCLPGICSDCDMIANGYGTFDYIQELVEAGAKVINASWTTCGFGVYHKNVQERIDEYYEEGILIVAASGNAKTCDRNLRDRASNYGYPASYKNVISVASVYGECGFYEDCIIEDPKYGTVAWKLKDRHVGRQRMKTIGSFDELTPINGQFETNHNLAVDIVTPTETYLPGRISCGETENLYGGRTSTSAAMVTGVIGLIWSANYCLASAEVESIIKLTAADIEHLPGNEPYKMKLGAGRLDAYKSVKMAHDMQLDKGVVTISDRDFYRFDFKLFSSPYQIDIQNQTFRDSSTVDFKARKQIHLKPNTHLKPDKNGYIKLKTDPDLPIEECFPKEAVKKPKLERDSVSSHPRYPAPFIIKTDTEISGVQIIPEEHVIDTDYEVTINIDKQKVFSQKYSKTDTAFIPLPNIKNQSAEIIVVTQLYRMVRNIWINLD